MEKYSYELLNYWNSEDDLYINYVVTNNATDEKANVVMYSNTSDIGCDYNNANEKELHNCLYKLISQGNGNDFKLPKVSELSPLLKDIYDNVCENDSNMCHITNDEWNAFCNDYGYSEKYFKLLKKEVKKYHLEDVLTLDDGEYKICGYGNLQCCFNDDRSEEKEYVR